MKTAPVITAPLAFDADGIPFSARYGDRYHPRHGALAQAAHVFLAGNGLPGRWQGRDRFVILETGFGLGNNFLAAWKAWRADPQRCARLHFISIEKHPLAAHDLQRAHAVSPLPELAAALVRAWPPLTPNLHRLAFDNDRVELLLALGDVAAWLPEIVASVDAFFLDGFAPDRNPAMWQPRVFKALARLAAPGATAATWSAASVVRAGLAAAGFEVHSAPGSGGKREITLARYAPRFTPRRAPSRLAASDAAGERHALIVGAGLAGCAAAWALAGQGWRSTLFDRHASIAAGGSGNPAGIFHGTFNADDGAHARFNRAAALQAAIAIRDAVANHGVRGQVNGLLRLESTLSIDAMKLQAAALGMPPDYVQALDVEDAARLCGLPPTLPAWFYPEGGWVDPAGFAASLLEGAGCNAELRTQTAVAAIRRRRDAWQLLDADGRLLDEAGVVVLANAYDAASLLDDQTLQLQRIRGQITTLALGTPGLRMPRLPVAGNGYVLPPLPDGSALFGATAQVEDLDPRLRADDQRHNLTQLLRLTGSLPTVADSLSTGRVGWRCVAPDRLPLIGGVAEVAAVQPGTRIDQPRFVPRQPGLHLFTALASRGIPSAALGARTLASLISGAPCPLEASLLDAVDAARFVSRGLRRRQAART
ncbi:MAG: bifunctional tRNA (5-methylaminomethyl-2-thiouridine)(34)-methyltransferase MnmD/FAD-dependent 5-carboxymethylaminomethyl-2-thiouridine(34) oxidoreductase MnmC [Burkholderiaceae bacterium]|nr:bifunctional tRNA (5-methylaminomethyl-2-thiouridine)(34)-methyltransferase MnmD/FAD-dependent 5-carboxymethylaminomethyl-2-thiouridine(34) oxidoreductase MnmC [Burkholderiaceae bacterium]